MSPGFAPIEIVIGMLVNISKAKGGCARGGHGHRKGLRCPKFTLQFRDSGAVAIRKQDCRNQLGCGLAASMFLARIFGVGVFRGRLSQLYPFFAPLETSFLPMKSRIRRLLFQPLCGLLHGFRSYSVLNRHLHVSSKCCSSSLWDIVLRSIPFRSIPCSKSHSCLLQKE